ncbi:hypothetical protein SAFG77S_12215 [Streptomyces afghaniensis]
MFRCGHVAQRKRPGGQQRRSFSGLRGRHSRMTWSLPEPMLTVAVESPDLPAGWAAEPKLWTGFAIVRCPWPSEDHEGRLATRTDRRTRRCRWTDRLRRCPVRRFIPLQTSTSHRHPRRTRAAGVSHVGLAWPSPVLVTRRRGPRCGRRPVLHRSWSLSTRTGPPVVTDWTAARAMARAARASSPVAEGVRSVRTLSVKSASSAT